MSRSLYVEGQWPQKTGHNGRDPLVKLEQNLYVLHQGTHHIKGMHAPANQPRCPANIQSDNNLLHGLRLQSQPMVDQ